MPDEQDQKQDEMSYRDYGLSPEEGKELNSQLDAAEWQALLAVQQMLRTAPLAAPDAAFSNRVLTRLATRERARAQKRSALGGLIFAFGSLLLVGFVIWSSPLVPLLAGISPASAINGIASLVPAAATVLVVASTFGTALLAGNTGIGLMLMALFASGLTLIWTRIVMRPALLNRPIRATEAH